MREDWAKRMADLLSPGGSLVCLEFPMYKDLKAPGPPWGLNGVYWDLLARGGNGLLNNSEEGVEQEVDNTRLHQGQFERVLYIKPRRSYENGKGTDMLSVWTKK